ncbi:hypothetical protein ABID22_002829 [Pontibacter aydingkolensis]
MERLLFILAQVGDSNFTTAKYKLQSISLKAATRTYKVKYKFTLSPSKESNFSTNSNKPAAKQGC